MTFNLELLGEYSLSIFCADGFFYFSCVYERSDPLRKSFVQTGALDRRCFARLLHPMFLLGCELYRMLRIPV